MEERPGSFVLYWNIIPPQCAGIVVFKEQEERKTEGNQKKAYAQNGFSMQHKTVPLVAQLAVQVQKDIKTDASERHGAYGRDINDGIAKIRLQAGTCAENVKTRIAKRGNRLKDTAVKSAGNAEQWDKACRIGKEYAQFDHGGHDNNIARHPHNALEAGIADRILGHRILYDEAVAKRKPSSDHHIQQGGHCHKANPAQLYQYQKDHLAEQGERRAHIEHA